MSRRRNPPPRPEGPHRKPAPHPVELSEGEREAVLAVLYSPEFADKSPGQAYAILLDRSVYLCSEATMYRLLRADGNASGASGGLEEGVAEDPVGFGGPQ